MIYELRECFRITAYSHFDKPMAKKQCQDYPNDHDVLNLILDNNAEYATIDKVYTARECPPF